MVLLDGVKDASVREWYLRAALEYGWSRNVLVHHIATQLHERQGKSAHQLLPDVSSMKVRVETGLRGC
jgi:predicted nuclease of restriction endonuclease-like (RecB) superfamily